VDSPYLCAKEVKRRLELYEDDDVTNELQDFGNMLVANATQRISRLNSTASVTVAYCAGLITVLTSTATIWSRYVGPWTRILPIVAAGISGLAAIIAVGGMTLRTVAWFSQDDWMNADCLSNPRRLKKFHILCMWKVISTYDAAYEKKTTRVKWSQGLTVAAFVLLFLTLLVIAWQLSFV
jgi:hypothetical protein